MQCFQSKYCFLDPLCGGSSQYHMAITGKGGHVCDSYTIRDNTGVFCYRGLGELLSPVVGQCSLRQSNGQKGNKIWAREFSKTNVSCLTCLGQLKCLLLKQNYCIVNGNELQSLRSLPGRHKRKAMEGTNSQRKFGVTQIISIALLCNTEEIYRY